MDLLAFLPKVVLIFALMMRSGYGLWLPQLIQEHSEHVNVDISRHAPVGHERQFADTLPDGFDVKLHLQDRPLSLSLKRISHADVNLPLYTSRDGKIIREYLDLVQNTGFYEDVNKDALIVLEQHSPDPERDHFALFGTFRADVDRYMIQKSNITTRSNDKHFLHVVTKTFSDNKTNPDTLLYQQRDHKRPIRSVADVQKNIVELLMVADYSVFDFWRQLSADNGTKLQRESEAKQNIMTYYAYILYGIDQRYRGITGQSFTIDVVSAGLLILSTPGDLRMTELNKTPATPRHTLEQLRTIEMFRDWIYKNPTLPKQDHAMLFTHYDFVAAERNILGIAYSGGMCSKYSVSITEDNWNPATTDTAAHELGHSLGSRHDGDNNGCSASDNYSMAPRKIWPMPVAGRWWKFSSCSVTYFKKFINGLNAKRNNCLLETSPSNNYQPTTARPMANWISPDRTCRFTFGEEYFAYRGYDNYDEICSKLRCARLTAKYTKSVLPPDDTSCGYGKVCRSGHCVSVPGAPEVSDNCPLGDQPGVIVDDETCSDVKARYPGACYQTTVMKICCESCGALYTGIKGCEYGDHSTECRAFNCPHYTKQAREWCCKTCG